jgi:hypothetical protein
MMTPVLFTVTGTVMLAAFASVIVTVHAPVSFPGVTVKVAAAPADRGVALALTCATNAFEVGNGVGTGLGLGLQLIAAVNAAVSPASETLSAAVLPPAVKVIEPGEATGVAAGVGEALGVGVGLDVALGVGLGVALGVAVACAVSEYRAKIAGCDEVIGTDPGTDANDTVVPFTVAGSFGTCCHAVPL